MLKQPVLHADETPVAKLRPARLQDGKTRKAYLWNCCMTGFNPSRAVVFDFADSRGGQHVCECVSTVQLTVVRTPCTMPSAAAAKGEAGAIRRG